MNRAEEGGVMAHACPHCASDDLLFEDFGWKARPSWCVACVECEACGPVAPTRAEALKKWNRRIDA